jgi:hypothetical protein
LSTFYRQNQNLIQKNKKNKLFSLEEGGYVCAPCCSILINLAQFWFTFESIYANKGDVAMFWLPQLIRADLETQFKSIRNLSAFRDFIGGTLGDYLFQEQRIVDENETVDSNYLKTFNMTLKSAPS